MYILEVSSVFPELIHNLFPVSDVYKVPPHTQQKKPPRSQSEITLSINDKFFLDFGNNPQSYLPS